MDTIFNRTENGTTTTVSIHEGLAELTHAMTEGAREVRSLMSGRDRHSIEYKDGRTVTLILADAPSPTAEAEEWATANSSFTMHRFRNERALCRKSIRPRHHTRSTGEYSTRSYVQESSAYKLCPRCDAK